MNHLISLVRESSRLYSYPSDFVIHNKNKDINKKNAAQHFNIAPIGLCNGTN
ncbi:hypothetical protein JOD45_003179 [Scopulibacillus daqui]|uniref:Uncharacterized protein n=1 Tax=Scopulibacillus daqui TaxID=1469162 RepID=A0ABS2Q3S4_9BACL|nr:hypothetical protein [Scopulibacillus daqui]